MDNFGTLELTVYKNHRNQWVFDDADVGLVQEAFVAGADKVMDKLTEDYTVSARKGFKLYMRDMLPENTENSIEITHSEALFHDILGKSNYYNCDALGHRVWLCPNLYRFVTETPQVIWFWAEEIIEPQLPLP